MNKKFIFGTVVQYRQILPALIGIMKGTQANINELLLEINTKQLSFDFTQEINTEIWYKLISNVVSNSVCPLLEVDNGIFYRDENAKSIVSILVNECIAVAAKIGIELDAESITQKIFKISEMAEGQLNSTLQDINNNRRTEIESLNLAVAKLSESIGEPQLTSVTQTLGNLILIKSQREKPV